MVSLYASSRHHIVLKRLDSCYVFRVADQGHTVVGIEVAQQAIEEFFQEQGLKYSCEDVRDFKLFKVSANR